MSAAQLALFGAAAFKAASAPVEADQAPAPTPAPAEPEAPPAPAAPALEVEREAPAEDFVQAQSKAYEVADAIGRRARGAHPQLAEAIGKLQAELTEAAGQLYERTSKGPMEAKHLGELARTARRLSDEYSRAAWEAERTAGGTPFCLGDALIDRLQLMNESAEAETRRLQQLHADIEGCTVEELPALIAARKAKEQADREAAKKERESRPPPPPKEPKAPAKKKGRKAAAPEAATQADALRKLTPRQVELLKDFAWVNGAARYQKEGHVPDWRDVGDVFLALGAKWVTGKPGGFRFPDASGEQVFLEAQRSGAIVDAKLVDYFPTPRAVVDRMLALLDLKPGQRVLEPSAGRGAIVGAALERGAQVVAVELLDVNAKHIPAHERLRLIVGRDFLALGRSELGEPFDAIPMNPPFSFETEHIRHAFAQLRIGGRLVSVASASVKQRADSKNQAFRDWVSEQGGRIEALPEGSFEESGTGVNTVLVILERKQLELLPPGAP